MADLPIDDSIQIQKTALRAELRAARKAHVAALPQAVSALLFKRPPAPLMELVPAGAVIGLYHAVRSEAPVHGYAKFFQEEGHRIALPRVTSEDGRMDFAEWSDPYEDSGLMNGPFGMQQPAVDLPDTAPAVIFVPLIGFTRNGGRLGQGGGYYDRWMAANPDTVAIGIGWDCQQVDSLPMEPHDRRMTAIVTPTRFYGPLNA